MQRFTNAGRVALSNKNWYGALTIALTLPDVCGSLQWPNNRSEKRYKRWCKRWIVPIYTHEIGPLRESHCFMSADDLYQVRCSLIHSGRGDIVEEKRGSLHRFEFCDDTVGSHCNWMAIGNRPYLQIKTEIFCEDMFKAVEDWAASVASDADVQKRIEGLLVIRSKGAIIDGVQWG